MGVVYRCLPSFTFIFECTPLDGHCIWNASPLSLNKQVLTWLSVWSHVLSSSLALTVPSAATPHASCTSVCALYASHPIGALWGNMHSRHQNYCYAPGCWTGYSCSKDALTASLFLVPPDKERHKEWERNFHRADKNRQTLCGLCVAF